MADSKVSALSAASTLDGSELLHVVQGGADRKATAAAIAGLITNEMIDDRVAALLAAGAGITISYNDAANTLTISSSITQYTDEMVDDRVAALLVAGSNITLTYNDAANTLTIASTGGTGTTTTAPVVNDTGTSLTIATAHAGKVVRQNNAAAITNTIPTNASDAIPVESVISFRQVGAGQISIVVSVGVTLNTPTGVVAKSRGQGSTIMLHKVATNEWDLTGDLATS